MGVVEALGRGTVAWVEQFGDFWRFTAHTHRMLPAGLARRTDLAVLMRQMFEVGTRSVPVVLITGLFVGMVLAVQAVAQFQAIGMEGQLGAIVNLSVLRELGPVLAGILIAGRVGGAFAAELGTMRVTEQIDALRAMGTDPVRYLVVPRYLACVILGPFLVLYADLMGIVGGYYVSVWVYNINAAEYWRHSAAAVEFFDIFMGLVKSVLFGGAVALICCHKAFRSAPGAAGVGRACTESFVASCVVILALDFFVNVVLNAVYTALYETRPLFG